MAANPEYTEQVQSNNITNRSIAEDLVLPPPGEETTNQTNHPSDGQELGKGDKEADQRAIQLKLSRSRVNMDPRDTFVNDPRGLLCEVLADAKIESKSPLSLPGKNNLLTSLVLGGSCYVEADGNGDVFTAPQELYEVRTIAQSRTNVQGVPGAVLSRTSNFTNKRLDEPITVSPGQLIAAIVRIRFE